MSYGQEFVLTLFTNDPDFARVADAAGVNRIGLDLERIGKHKRQDASKAWISDHCIEEFSAVRDALSDAAPFARTNPIHDGSAAEIQTLIDAGAQVLMLPMFRTVSDAAKFIELVDGRAAVSLLVETGAAALRLHEIVKLDGIDEIHIGLNDMHLDLSLANHFEVLTSGFVDMLSEIVVNAGIPFGFAGVGRAGDCNLPIPADLIYAQYPRLGATRALVARSFYGADYTSCDMAAEVYAARNMFDHWRQADDLQSVDSLHRLRKKVSLWTNC